MKPFFDYRLYIFDLDNTVYNENDYLFGAYAEIASSLGNDEYAEFLNTTFQNEGRVNLFDKLATRFGLGHDTIAACLQILRTYQPAGGLKMYNDIFLLLNELKKEKKAIVLLTNGNVEQQRNKISNIKPPLTDFFSMIVYANEIARKPSPASVEMILQQTGVSKNDSLMIGDDAGDELTAQNAGVDFIYAEELRKTVI